eukprot:CAMPEP_0170740172 /NCGR_PEP_ID=MMETSP0437-20130122/5543_1 /TAXON_ID=0 /ORGANISM="Sexangularia sp." /LENGTH=407 /DNA_ID=CAMNT_0011078657 /DNA_START=100 /DNA_END=1323 /DNA_ORIENTATION=-
MYYIVPDTTLLAEFEKEGIDGQSVGLTVQSGAVAVEGESDDETLELSGIMFGGMGAEEAERAGRETLQLIGTAEDKARIAERRTPTGRPAAARRLSHRSPATPSSPSFGHAVPTLCWEGPEVELTAHLAACLLNQTSLILGAYVDTLPAKQAGGHRAAPGTPTATSSTITAPSSTTASPCPPPTLGDAIASVSALSRWETVVHALATLTLALTTLQLPLEPSYASSFSAWLADNHTRLLLTTLLIDQRTQVATSSCHLVGALFPALRDSKTIRVAAPMIVHVLLSGPLASRNAVVASAARETLVQVVLSLPLALSLRLAVAPCTKSSARPAQRAAGASALLNLLRAGHQLPSKPLSASIRRFLGDSDPAVRQSAKELFDQWIAVDPAGAERARDAMGVRERKMLRGD